MVIRFHWKLALIQAIPFNLIFLSVEIFDIERYMHLKIWAFMKKYFHPWEHRENLSWLGISCHEKCNSSQGDFKMHYMPLEWLLSTVMRRKSERHRDSSIKQLSAALSSLESSFNIRRVCVYITFEQKKNEKKRASGAVSY